MSEAEEEARAALFRAEMASRARFVAENRRTLAGSPSARRTLLDNWGPWWKPQPVVVEPIHRNDPETNAD